MDPRTDGERFKKLMDELYVAYHGRLPPKREPNEADPFTDVNWRVLRDMDYAEVKANVERLIATAAPGAPMPRPSQLRSTRASVVAPPSPAMERAERIATRNWEELRRRDPVTHQIEWRLAVAFRRMGDAEDEEHAEWVAEYRRWNTLRYAPRAEQEAAVRKVLGQ